MRREGVGRRASGLGLALLAACGHPVSRPSASQEYRLGGLVISGAPEVDQALVAAMQPYDDAVGYHLLDFDPERGVLANRGGDLVHVRAPGARPEVLTSDLDVVSATFVPGGITFTADRDGDEQLHVYRLAGGKREDAGSAERISEVAPTSASAADGSLVASTVDDGGASLLDLYDPHTRTHRAAPGTPRGGAIDELRFARQAPIIAFSFSDARHPRDIYSYDPATARLDAWTHSDVTALRALVAPTREHVASFDGTSIAMLVYRPAQRGPAPVVVELHGGPEDRFQPSWAPFEQFLVARGFAVVQPDVRGSLGYGAAFAALDDGTRREDAVRDVGAVLDWIATRPELDARAVSVLGTSYGGYLALAALIAYGDRLRAGGVISGIADFVSFLEHTARYRADERRAEYGDERDPSTRAHLAQISPLARASAIRAPLLVAHGARDPRVPVGDSDRLVATVRGAGGRAWYVRADDEGHGFAKLVNRDVLQALVIQLFAGAAVSGTGRR